MAKYCKSMFSSSLRSLMGTCITLWAILTIIRSYIVSSKLATRMDGLLHKLCCGFTSKIWLEKYKDVCFEQVFFREMLRSRRKLTEVLWKKEGRIQKWHRLVEKWCPSSWNGREKLQKRRKKRAEGNKNISWRESRREGPGLTLQVQYLRIEYQWSHLRTRYNDKITRYIK